MRKLVAEDTKLTINAQLASHQSVTARVGPPGRINEEGRPQEGDLLVKDPTISLVEQIIFGGLRPLKYM